jgi:hypothetical protein
VFALPHWVWTVAITAVCGAALWKGGPSERIAAMLFYVAWIASRLLRDDNRLNPQWGVLAIDVMLFVLLAALALRSTRFWPMCMAGFELLAVITHAGRLADPRLGGWVYLTAEQIWSYMTLIALAVGVTHRWQERRQLTDSGDATAEPGATRR